MAKRPAPRSLDDWIHNPSFEDSICDNPFHSVVAKVFSGYKASSMDPWWDESSTFTKIAKLMYAGLILPEGDVIYVKQGDNLIPLGEAVQLLASYMHTDTKVAKAAIEILESNFLGYFRVTGGKVWRNGIALVDDEGNEEYIDLSTLNRKDGADGVPEYGRHDVNFDNYEALFEFFELINQAVGEPYFFEKVLLYPFNQRIREKSHVLVGKGGNGKSVFMRMVQTLYGDRAYTDAPQPNFKGHDPQTIAYNFIGKRVVTFNDVGDPSEAFLEWLKRMITGNLEVKTPSGAWLSIPCNTNFLMETNHAPAILDIEAHNRRYIVRTFDDNFRLIDHMSSEKLDRIGERGELTAGDLVFYLRTAVKDNVKDWTEFVAPVRAIPEAAPLEF